MTTLKKTHTRPPHRHATPGPKKRKQQEIRGIMKKAYLISIIFVLLLSPLGAKACNVLIAYDYLGLIDSTHGVEVAGMSPENIYKILSTNGHNVDTVVMKWPHEPWGIRHWASPVGYDVACYWIMNPVDSSQQYELRNWVFSGGKLILIGEHWNYPTNDILNGILGNLSWTTDIGKPQLLPLPYIECDSEGISTIEDGMYLPGWMFPCVDSLFPETAPNSSSVILLEDSSECDSCGILLRLDSTYTRESIPYPVLGTYSKYGDGVVYVFGDGFIVADAGLYPGLDSFDNAEFTRDLFRCGSSLDDAWLDVARARVILSLEGDTSGIIWDSIYVTFDEDSFFTVDLDWNYYTTGIDFLAMGDTGYSWVCVVRVPGPTGESLLPCGPICDSLWLEPYDISEAPTPASFEISIHPNPFNSVLNITRPVNSEIEIFDISGRIVYEMPVGSRPASTVLWQPNKSVPSGVYLVRARFDKLSDRGDIEITKRVVYLK
ncbi:T9SS type A sorting domain-containing protein [bacterium]|nr:T9SS type A sorting domain-containing protein [bacterium]